MVPALSDERRAVLERLADESAGLTPKQVSIALGRPTSGYVRKPIFTMKHAGQLAATIGETLPPTSSPSSTSYASSSTVTRC
jgi:hypothetical protein